MFRGSSYHTIDTKGRFIIPARFRDIIRVGGGDGVMLTRMDGSIFAYTYDEWGRIESRILSMAEKSDAVRKEADAAQRELDMFNDNPERNSSVVFAMRKP